MWPGHWLICTCMSSLVLFVPQQNSPCRKCVERLRVTENVKIILMIIFVESFWHTIWCLSAVYLSRRSLTTRATTLSSALDGLHPYHMCSLEERQQRAAVTCLSPPPSLLSFPVKVLSSFLFLPPSPSVSPHLWGAPDPSISKALQATEGWDCRIGVGGGVRWLLWLTVLIITVMGTGWGKWRASSCFLKCHHQRPPHRWYCSLWERDAAGMRE